MKKWFLRILTAFVVIAGFGLLSLHLLSGTTDSHKRSLEQAFSSLFKGSATFGTLKEFNLIPHLIVSVEDLHIAQESGASIESEEMAVAYGAGDLILKNRKIEMFHLKNFRMSAGAYLPLDLTLSDAGLYAGDSKDKGKFAFEGTYGGKPIKGQVDMTSQTGAVSKYQFADDNRFTMNLGSLQISGVLSPYVGKAGEVKNLSVYAATKSGRQDCKIPAEKTIPSGVFFHDVLAEFAKVKTPTSFDVYCQKLLSAP